MEEISFNLPIYKFVYDNGVTIYAPLKCGTRWLRTHTHPVKEIQIHHRDINTDNVDGKSFFIFRSPIEHLNSAIHTEILSRMNNTLLYEIMTSIYHWTPTLWRDLSWNLKEGCMMRFIPLEFLTKWFENSMGNEIVFHREDYNFEKESGLDRELILTSIKSSYKEIYQSYLLEAVIEKGVMLEFTQKYLAPILAKPNKKIM